MSGSRRARSFGAPRPAIAVGVLILLALTLAGCSSGKSTYHYQWNLFFQAIFQPDSQIGGGLFLTVIISIVAQLAGVILGVFAALGKMSKVLPNSLACQRLRLDLPGHAAGRPARVLLLRP